MKAIVRLSQIKNRALSSVLALLGFMMASMSVTAQEPGDMPVIGISPDEMLYVTLSYIPAGTELHITERNYTGGTWVASPDGGSGNVTITAGTNGIPVGSYLMITGLSTTPAIATGTGYFSDYSISNVTSFSFDFQGSNANSATVLKVHKATGYNGDPTGNYIWVIGLGNYTPTASAYFTDTQYNNCVVSRANNSNTTSINIGSSGTTMDKQTALDYISNPTNWSSGTVISTVTVPTIASIDLANTTWSGSAWDNGAPTNAMDAIIAGNYNTATNGALTVGGDLTINDGVTLTVDGTTNSVVSAAGTVNLSTSGTLLMLCSESGFATFPAVTEFTGSGTVQYQITIANSGWHHVTSPASIALGDIAFHNGTTLSYLGTSTNIYKWEAATASWIYCTALDDFQGSAYTVYLPAGEVIDMSFMGSSFVNPSSVLSSLTYFDPSGALPGNSSTGWTTSVEDGWNMIGNPYPAYIDWDVLDDNVSNFTNMDLAVYVWNPGTSTYDSYSSAVGGSFMISPFQAFFVRATGVGAQLLQAADARANAGSARGWKTTSDDGVERFTISAVNNGNVTQNSFAFMNVADESKDVFDTYAFDVPADQVYLYSTTTDSVRVNNQALPTLTQSMSTYLTAYHATAGESITLVFEESNMSAFRKVTLTDLYTGAVTELTDGASYTFTVVDGHQAQRFLLDIQMGNATVSLEEQTSELNASIYAVDGGYAVELPENVNTTGANYEIYDLSGALLAKGQFEGNFAILPYTSNTPSMKVVRIECGAKFFVGKVMSL